MADNTEEREAGKTYLTNKIASISNLSGDNLSWNHPLNKDGYELIVTSGGKQVIYEVSAMDLIDPKRRRQLDEYANDIAREFS